MNAFMDTTTPDGMLAGVGRGLNCFCFPVRMRLSGSIPTPQIHFTVGRFVAVN